MRFMLSGMTNVVVAVFSDALSLLLLPQNGLCSGICSQQNSFNTSIGFPLNASTSQAEHNHRLLHHRHAGSDWIRGEKLYNSSEQISMWRPPLVSLSLAIASRRGCSDLPKKMWPGWRCEAPRFIWFGCQRGKEAANRGKRPGWEECLFAITCAMVP